MKQIYLIALLLTCCLSTAQDVALYQQFNGRYDFTFIGNTMNPQENGNLFAPCVANTSSTASLALDPSNVIEKAFLYWAGSGEGDFEVKLNGVDVVPERTFSLNQVTPTVTLPFFAAFADITGFVLQNGNMAYTLSELDINPVIEQFCPNRTNFAGWAILIVYQNDALPLNQLNVYDGLQYVSQFQNELSISLPSLNVIDNEGARIGFIAWEGDSNISVNETLRVNGNIIESPPLNPWNNAFNGTNSIIGSNQLFNMDLDIYNIQSNIAIGDTSALIQLTSGQDFVMINTIVTKLNSQLPDATVAVDGVFLECDSRVIACDYTVYNINSTDVLPAGTPLAVYADGVLVAQSQTVADLPIGGSFQDQISFALPDGIPDTFSLVFVIDDDGNHMGEVTELSEANNSFEIQVSLMLAPQINSLPPVYACNLGSGSAVFDLSQIPVLALSNPAHQASVHTTHQDAENNLNAIPDLTHYPLSQAPVQLFVRVWNESCHAVAPVDLKVRNCPPTIYNYVSANGDGVNDTFFIDGLRDIFLNFNLQVYNRWGVLLWEGNNNTPDWGGISEHHATVGNGRVPDGTYFYLLDLNDPDYPEPFTGFLYLNH